METSFYSLGAGYDPQYYSVHYMLTGEEQRRMLHTGCRGYHKTVCVVIEEGCKAGDLLGMIPFFVSDRVLRVFDDNGFVRYETFPVEVSGGRREPLPRYHGIAFHGRGGPLLEEESGCVWSVHADGTRKLMRTENGVVFDTSKWDGSDLFYLEELPGTRIVTARVKDALQKAEITNCDFIPLEEVLRFPVKKR